MVHGRKGRRIAAAAAAGEKAAVHPRRRRRGPVVQVLFVGAPTGVHEEVGDGRRLEAELVGDRRLHVLARSLRLLEDGRQRPALDVREDETGLLVRNDTAAVRMAMDGDFVRTQLTI